MAEKVLNSPLSGEEIILAIADQVATHLRRDCYLTPNTAYEKFSASVSIRLVAHDAGRNVEVNTIVRAGQPLAADFFDEHEEEQYVPDLEIEPAPPNQVRVETGQPVPVLTKDETGRAVTKGVTYARRGRARE